jgi:hypothetical protein
MNALRNPTMLERKIEKLFSNAFEIVYGRCGIAIADRVDPEHAVMPCEPLHNVLLTERIAVPIIGETDDVLAFDHIPKLAMQVPTSVKRWLQKCKRIVLMKTLLVCHAGDKLNQIGLARWLASFSDLSMVIIHETKQRKQKRIRREIKRVGYGRFLDVLAFRLYYRLLYASQDAEWEDRRLACMVEAYPDFPSSIQVLHTASPNSDEALKFIRDAQPDIMIARCKTLLKETIFSIPARGTYVMHPGICPEYRNAHGCFWALVNNDYQRVGMTLLRVDKGVDTGAVYGYYSYAFDPANDSHVVIQHRVVLDNLETLRQRLEEIDVGRAQVIDTSGRMSATWGQPWLSRYLLWKWQLKKQKKENEGHIASLS